MKQKYITREQKKQVNRFLQQIYGFPFKAGGAYLCGAHFEKQGLYTSVYTLQKQAIRRIQHSGAAYISLNILSPGRAIAEGRRNICGGSITSSSISTFSKIFLRTTKP